MGVSVVQLQRADGEWFYVSYRDYQWRLALQVLRAWADNPELSLTSDEVKYMVGMVTARVRAWWEELMCPPPESSSQPHPGGPWPNSGPPTHSNCKCAFDPPEPWYPGKDTEDGEEDDEW